MVRLLRGLSALHLTPCPPPAVACVCSCSASSPLTLLSAPQNVHCVAYFVEIGNSGTKNSVNFVTRLRRVCAAGFPQRPHTRVSIASWYR